MVAPLYTTESGLLFHAGKILVLTVGLPARGKTHISRSLERYLRWTGVKIVVVSLGDYRRKILGSAGKLPSDYFTLGAKSEESIALRKQVADACEDTIQKFFDGGGQVVIYDANNGVKANRTRLAEKFDKLGIHVVFLESWCDNQEMIERNIRSVKISSPDYRGWNPDKAIEDYYSRIRDHEKHYQSLEETTWPSIRIINVGEQVITNKIAGYLQSRIVFFLMNIHNRFRNIYFARSGQSLIEHSYRADSDLSPSGWAYAEKLKNFVTQKYTKSLSDRGIDGKSRRLVIWTSSRMRCSHTAWPFLTASQLNVKIIEKPQMCEINPGIWDGLTPEQVKKYYPDDWERFSHDPYAYRAPRAESYHDLCVRLDPVLIELEREKADLLIIGHASVIRCMLAYLIGLPVSEIPAIEVTRGDLIEVVPASYGVQTQAYHFWDGDNGDGSGNPRTPHKDESNLYENYAEDAKKPKSPLLLSWESTQIQTLQSEKTLAVPH